VISRQGALSQDPSSQSAIMARARTLQESIADLYALHRTAVECRLRLAGVKHRDIEDLVHSVFLIALEKHSSLPKRADDRKAWLLTTARRVAANWHRLHRHECEIVDLVRVLEEPDRKFELDCEAQIILRDLLRTVGAQIEPYELEIIVRSVLRDESTRELGASMGIAKAAAHLRLQMARRRMARKVIADRPNWGAVPAPRQQPR
jgi:DNA-directed RNA polymerase specialized sigma24 family protein